MPTNAFLQPSPALPAQFKWEEYEKDCSGGFRPCVVAGIRPKRVGGYRLELIEEHGIAVCHNYGHGGAGITMSWGCAEEVYDQLKSKYPPDQTTAIAVLGAGVIGLTTAAVLLEKGYCVRIYAKAKSPDTTSDVAGGQWSPSVVDIKPGNKDEFDRILIRSYRKFTSLLNKGYGVVERPNYVYRPEGKLGKTFKRIPESLVTKTKLSKLPFDSSFVDKHGGWQVDTLLVEPPIFLKRLMADLETEYGVTPIIRTFKNLSDIKQLSETVIVNCTGYGAKGLFGDCKLFGIKGQLILLPPQPQLEYLFSAGNEYIFPRSDALVVGGSFEVKYADTAPTELKCDTIWRNNRMLFSPRRLWVRENFFANAAEYIAENAIALWRNGFRKRDYYEIEGVRYTDL
jgi:hypothetical protein